MEVESHEEAIPECERNILRDITIDQRVEFFNRWNAERDLREKI